MNETKAPWILSGLVATGAVVLTWLFHGESSPLNDYFSFHVRLPNIWGILNAIPFIAGAVVSGNRGGGPVVLFIILQFIQWFLVTFVLSTAFYRVLEHGERERHGRAPSALKS